LLFRVRRINEELTYGYPVCIEDQVRSVVAAADEIKMPGDKKLGKWRELVYGDYDTFLKSQYKHAIKAGHMDRAVRVMVRRKDLMIFGNGDAGTTFDIHKFPKLKVPLSWAKEKWITWGKSDKIAANMLKFQWESIHAPLTTALDSAEKERKKAVSRQVSAAFETIQKYMGQRNTSKMPQRITELIKDSLKNPEVRTEVYIAFIKQTTDNPEPEKIERAWELLSLCLSVFPPSSELEDYLESWLRHPDNNPNSDKYHCRGLLRRRVLEGADEKAAAIPQEQFEDVQKVLAKRVQPLRFVWPSYDKKSDKPSWADLKKSYLEKGASLKISKPPAVVIRKNENNTS